MLTQIQPALIFMWAREYFEVVQIDQRGPWLFMFEPGCVYLCQFECLSCGEAFWVLIKSTYMLNRQSATQCEALSVNMIGNQFS